MTVKTIKAERVIRTSLGLLERDTVLANLVWRDAAGDFRGARGDAVTIRLPAYSKARKRNIRNGGNRLTDNLTERTVVVTLDSNLYNKIPITDPELTLDIDDFNRTITVPVTNGLVRGLEDEIIAEVEAATYPVQHQLALDLDEPYKTVTAARRRLNDARVPMDGRAIVCGSGVEEVFLNSEQFIRADRSGDTGAFRSAEIGRVAGFPVFVVPGMDPDKAFAFHRSAFVLSTRAPLVPRGAPWGASASWEGFSLRLVQAIDPDEIVDNFHADVYVGTNVVPDYGAFDEDGYWEPSVEIDDEHDEPVFVRAVEITATFGS
ncbi:MAG: hypothetical protein M0R75_14040 [Dehalococcoidia bacterium]|nr:hypothetical protein [Dehalococcoidia bacterium]